MGNNADIKPNLKALRHKACMNKSLCDTTVLLSCFGQLEHENRQLRQDLSLLSPVAGTQTGYEDPKLMTGIAASSVSNVHNVMLREEKGPYKYQMQPDAANDFASEQHQAFISEQRADFATPPLYDLDRTAVTGKTHGIADEPKQVLGGGFVQEMAM